jgi:TolB protein
VATGHQRRIFAVRPGKNRGLFLPTWSPKGRRIAVSRDSGGQRYEVLIINIRTGKVSISTKDIPGSQAQPDWAPTGQRIAYVSRGRTIGVLSTRSGIAHRVVAAHAVGFPSWEPDGARIAFSAVPAGGSAYQIMTVAPDGTGLTQVTHGKLLKLAPSFAPDRTRISFWGLNNDTGRSRIYAMDADGSNVQRLTGGPGFEAMPDWQPLP